MNRRSDLLSDAQWEKIGPLLPELKSRGRPWRSNREVLEGILWVLRSGARWHDLPNEYPSASTCWRRLRRWEEDGTWLRIWRTFIDLLDQQRLIDWREHLHQRPLRSDEKRGPAVGKTNRGKGPKLMVMADDQGVPLGGYLCSASPAEVTLVNATLACVDKNALIQRLIADKAYDSQSLRDERTDQQIELIAPHRKNSK